MVYGVLGKLRWRGGLERAEIAILHRGAPGDRRAVPGKDVLEVRPGFFTCRSGGGRAGHGNPGQETVIPLHRILEVRLDGRTVWKRAGKV